ncbi:MAG: AAA family ATPase [Spirochaetota bacterium]|nr:AAA family ATPase [Spirochaetota bacterium]
MHERILIQHRQGRVHTVLILDEAHLLSIDVLKELRLLANYEVDSVNAMTILLCGQESLLQKFGLSALEPLANSITVSVATDGLPKEETFSYVEGRITDCGGHAGLFTQGALKLIHQASVGVLRTVGTIATSAMVKAYHAGLPTIEAEHVQAVLTR